MKIAQIVCAFPPYHGGIGNVAYAWADSLGIAGHEVVVFTPAYNEKKITADNFSINYLPPLLRYGNGALLMQLPRLLPKYHIVHLHYPFFGSAEIIWLAKLLNKQKINLFIHYHMDTLSLSLPAKLLSAPGKLMEHSLFNQAAAITCASLDYIDSSSIKDYYRKNKNKFLEIPFGVDSGRFKPGTDWQKLKNKILFVGSLDSAHNFKGLDVLLRAISMANSQQVVLTVVGGGNLLPQYQALCQKLQILDKVKFAGSVSEADLPAYYQAADILVLPSINQHEAFGLVLLEALASGLPVIASNLPGVRGVFVNGEQGFLAKSGDANDLAGQIDNLFSNEQRWQKMCLSARQLALTKYSWPAAASKLIDLYTKCVQ